MLQHDITNNKYYSDGVEVTKAEYDHLWKEWHDNLPPPQPPNPNDEIYESEVYDILFGGAE